MYVLLKGMTAGYIEMADIGDIVTVKLHDENGMPCEATGKVIEILEDDPPWI